MTFQQAINTHYGQELHLGKCALIFGPRGGSKISVAKIRVSGKCKIWKTRPYEFRLPIKYGLYGYGAITHLNKDNFHLANECPLTKPEVVM